MPTLTPEKKQLIASKLEKTNEAIRAAIGHLEKKEIDKARIKIGGDAMGEKFHMLFDFPGLT